MAESKKSFLLYADLIHTVRKMPKDKAGELLLTILQYVNDEDPSVDDLLVDVVFEPIKQQLKRDLEKWDNKKEVRSKAGAAGGKKSGEVRSNAKQTTVKPLSPKQNEAKQAIASKDKQTLANEPVNVTVTVNDTVNVILEEVVVDADEENSENEIEEIELIEIPAAVFIDEEEKIAAAEFLKRHSAFAHLQKNQSLKPLEVLKLFDVFFDQKTALNELKGKSKDDLIKNFYWWVPKHIQANKQTNDANSNNRPKGNRQVSSGPDAKRADRHATLAKLHDILQGTEPK